MAEIQAAIETRNVLVALTSDGGLKAMPHKAMKTHGRPEGRQLPYSATLAASFNHAGAGNGAAEKW